MKVAVAVVGLLVVALMLPVLAVSAIAGAVMTPAALSVPACTGPTSIGSGLWQQPLRERYTISSRFGVRFHPVLHTTKLHTGTDLVTSGDPTIVAASAGTVSTREFNSAYGNQVVIDHGDGLQTRYAHMAAPASVRVGDHVDEGERLGVQGATGFVTGAHLHFEVIRVGRPIDPVPFMAARGAPLNGTSPSTVPASSHAADERSTYASKDGRRITLDSEQLANATRIVEIGREVGVGEAGTVVALMAALQESSLRNLRYGDRDSLGLFQQRSGWGSAAQRQDPDYATRAFFGGPTGPNTGRPPGLLDTPGWRSMQLGDAAQAVQVSALPDAYDNWEPVAKSLVAGVEVGAGHEDGCLGLEAESGQLRVATWNLCLQFCNEKLAPWRDRIQRIAAVIKAQRPSVISLQETGRRDSHGKALMEALAPEYKLAVYKRSKMILFSPDCLSTRATDKSRLDSIAFVIQGKGGVAQVFRDKLTGGTLVVSSLHPVDGNEQQRRSEYVESAFAKVAGLAARYPGSVVVHAGDLNSAVPGSPVAKFFATKGFRSAEQQAKLREGQAFRSYNGGRSPRRGSRIDHVMVRGGEVVVARWRQILSVLSDHPESDHNLIVTELSITAGSVPTGSPS